MCRVVFEPLVNVFWMFKQPCSMPFKMVAAVSVLVLLAALISELPVSLLSLLDASHSFIDLSDCCSLLEFCESSSFSLRTWLE
jgi:hypothetical protein